MKDKVQWYVFVDLKTHCNTLQQIGRIRSLARFLATRHLFALSSIYRLCTHTRTRPNTHTLSLSLCRSLLLFLSLPHIRLLSCVAVCCSVLQCVAVCCSVLHCCNAFSLYHTSVCSRVLQCVAVCCSVVQCGAVCCSVLQYVVVCCSVL